MADLYAGRYLEAWFPSNLPFDHFPFTLDVVVAATDVPHTVITNGNVSTVAANAWRIRFPSWFTTMSALVEIHPADALHTASISVRLPDSGQVVTVSAHKPVGGSEDLPACLYRIVALLSECERAFGGFPGDRYVCFFHGASGGMEYAQAATTSEAALRHEVIHSWFARGISPAWQADGWWDEGFTRYLETGAQPVAVNSADPPVRLFSGDAFDRTTSARAYDAGSRVFGGIAAMVGRDRLLAAMRVLYCERRRESVSTRDLQRHLIAETGAHEIADVFDRLVYGRG